MAIPWLPEAPGRKNFKQFGTSEAVGFSLDRNWEAKMEIPAWIAVQAALLFI